jgi:hypothetical protein
MEVTGKIPELVSIVGCRKKLNQFFTEKFLMATTCDRRRNMRAENCKACGKFCEAGQGYLYRDTHGRPNRYTGKFGWFVKCEECHSGNKTKLTVTLEKHAAAHANDPVIRPWSVASVKNWTVTRTTHEGDVAIRVDGKGFSEIVSGRDRINSRFTAKNSYTLEQNGLAGKPLSEKAAEHLGAQIFAIVVAVQDDERMAGNAAVDKLVAAGATVTLSPSGNAWKVKYKGGEYTLWGCVDGKNKVTGLAVAGVHGPWVETTAEELIAKGEQ